MSRRRRNETDEQRARRELIRDFLTAANIQSMDDIQELFKEALAGFMEGSLESELDSELGYEPYDVKNKETDNSRNCHPQRPHQRNSRNAAFVAHYEEGCDYPQPQRQPSSVHKSSVCGGNICFTELAAQQMA